MINAKNIILVVIIALGAWALSPPADATKVAKLGTASTGDAPAAKHVIRFHPGPLYLPGVVPENAKKPIEGIKRVGEAFSKLFRDTRIEFVGVPAGSREWLVTQLSSGQAPDVIMVNVEDVWQDIQKTPPWYVPLDSYLDAPNPFVEKGKPGSVKWWDMFKYPIPTRGTMAPDGKMYCIVLDMIETGIYYNKSIFNKLGLSEPRDWTEFMELQRKLKAAGYIPMLVDRTYLADWGADLTFEQMYGSMRDLIDLDYDPNRGEYLHGYLDWDEIIFLHREGFFSPRDPRWREVWRVLKEWRPFMCRDLNNEGTDFFRLFATEKGAMYWSHAMIVPRLVKDPDRKFDWGIFYLPSITKQVSRFADGHEQCVIGGSGMQYSVTNSSYRDTGDPANSERLKRVIAFLQFLTLPENCDTVVNEQIALLPNIVGVDPHPELLPFDRFLQRRYAMTKWFYTFDLRFGEVLLRMLEMRLNDGLTEEQFLDLMDRELTRAGETIVKRKSPDMERFERVWKEREGLRDVQGIAGMTQTGVAPIVGDVVTKVTTPLARGDRKERARDTLSLYALLAPTFILLAIFSLVPFIVAFVTSFYDYEVGGESRFVGLANYREYVTDYTFWPSFLNLIFLTAFHVIVVMIVPLIVAKLIFSLSSARASYIYRILFLLPIVVPNVAVYLIWKNVIYGEAGFVNEVLADIGLARLTRGWLSDPAWVLVAIAFIGFPFAGGINILIYYAGLTAIPDSVHEASLLDGATGLKKFLLIDVPLVMSQIKLLVMLTIIGGIQAFEAIFIITKGAPGFKSMVPGLWMYFNAFSFQRMGYACAIGVMLFLLIMVLTVLNLKYFRSAEQNQT